MGEAHYTRLLRPRKKRTPVEIVESEPLSKLKNAFLAFGIVYIPALLVTSSTLFGELSSQYCDNIGRIRK